MSDDYGYFGSGSEGYAHYNEAVNESQKSINNGGGKGNGGGNGGCLTSVIMIICVIAAVITVPFLLL